MNIWTERPSLDQRLLELVREHGPRPDWLGIAKTMTAEFGYAFTSDQVRSRARRISHAREVADIALSQPDQPEADLYPPIPVGTFVGLDIVFADIETTNLGAAWGHLLCASFCDSWGLVTTYRRDDPEFYNPDDPIDDSRLAAAIRDHLERYDIVVGHNVRLFDRPFLNARLLHSKERPLRTDQKYIDTLHLVGGQNLRLGSRRLDTVAKFLHLDQQKTQLDGDVHQQADAGNRAAMDLVVEHCEQDVRVLRSAWPYLKPFISVVHR